jgi:hypothetical protein
MPGRAHPSRTCRAARCHAGRFRAGRRRAATSRALPAEPGRALRCHVLRPQAANCLPCPMPPGLSPPNGSAPHRACHDPSCPASPRHVIPFPACLAHRGQALPRLSKPHLPRRASPIQCTPGHPPPCRASPVLPRRATPVATAPCRAAPCAALPASPHGRSPCLPRRDPSRLTCLAKPGRGPPRLCFRGRAVPDRAGRFHACEAMPIQPLPDPANLAMPILPFDAWRSRAKRNLSTPAATRHGSPSRPRAASPGLPWLTFRFEAPPVLACRSLACRRQPVTAFPAPEESGCGSIGRA